MSKNQSLYLNGYGYLDNIELRDQKWTVEICRIELFGGNPRASESLHLNCDVEESLGKLMPEYVNALLKGQTVIIQFKAQYQGVVALYSGLTADDPTQMVMFKAKLLEIECCQ